MGFAAIAVGIGIGAAYGRQAMPMAGYAYAPEICSLQIPINNLHLIRICSQNQNSITVSKAGLTRRLVKQSVLVFCQK
ncbi:MAG: hypothetical protein V7L29_31085 [Nostoc sp.]|uniref:hypothetical protein n=1 Tax=Nostoc sp. TaxID=1180 RepID=UPI002FFCD9C8